MNSGIKKGSILTIIFIYCLSLHISSSSLFAGIKSSQWPYNEEYSISAGKINLIGHINRNEKVLHLNVKFVPYCKKILEFSEKSQCIELFLKNSFSCYYSKILPTIDYLTPPKIIFPFNYFW